jgi:uncharacterized protein (TIGR03118 family)
LPFAPFSPATRFLKELFPVNRAPSPAIGVKAQALPLVEAMESRRHFSASKDFANHILDSTTKHVANNYYSFLEDPHGLTLFGGTTLITSNSGNNTTTAYDLTGKLTGAPEPFNFTIGGPPQASVEADTQGAFLVSGASNAPASVLYATANGQVYGLVSANTIGLALDDSSQGANFTGITIGSNDLTTYVYLCDMANARIDVYNNHFQLQTGYSFTDPSLPAGFVPDNVAAVNDEIAVSYVKLLNGVPQTNKGDGIVDLYLDNGTLLGRISSGLYEPYGLAGAGPNGYGKYDNDLLIGDHFTGSIYAYTYSGQYVGSVRNSLGHQVVVPGLWSIVTDDPSSGPGNIYYSAEPKHGTSGELGDLELLTGKKYGSP